MKRSPILRSSFAVVAVLAAGCASFNDSADLATNDLLYSDVAFRTKAPGDRPVYVLPVVDARDPQGLPTQERGFPIAYGGDDFWARPVREMIADVLARQLADSGLFAGLAEQATPPTWVLQPTLVAFTTGAKEAMAGSRSFAEVALLLQVLGPAVDGAERPVVWEQKFGSHQITEVDLNPGSPYRLIGRALQQTMAKALAGLDGSNVGRCNVPIQAPAATAATPAAASAAATRR